VSSQANWASPRTFIATSSLPTRLYTRFTARPPQSISRLLGSLLVKKPKWANLRKPHGKASGRSFTGAEAAEMAADKAEKSSKMPDRRPTREDSPESSDGEVIVPANPPRPPARRGVPGG